MTSIRSQRLARRINTHRARTTRALTNALRAFFREQADRVVRRYLAREGRKDVTDEIFDDDESTRLWRVMRPYVAEGIVGTAEIVAEFLGMDALVADDPRLLAILGQSSTRVVAISEGTRQAIRRTLVEGSDRNYSPYQIARGVPKDDFRGLRSVVEETYRGRADTIARTELAFSMQEAAHDRYREAGVIEVDIIDGPECGWTEHDDPDKADGTRRTMGEAMIYPLAHPNCRRTSTPVLESRSSRRGR